MSGGVKSNWVVGYDIANTRRLQRVHKLLKSEALRLQYSVYNAVKTPREIEALLADITPLIDESEDDVRAYHIPRSCKVWQLGDKTMTDGVILSGDDLMLLMQTGNVAEVEGIE